MCNEESNIDSMLAGMRRETKVSSYPNTRTQAIPEGEGIGIRTG